MGNVFQMVTPSSISCLWPPQVLIEGETGRTHIKPVAFGSSLAQAAVSVRNPPSGSQTCFPGGWVR